MVFINWLNLKLKAKYGSKSQSFQDYVGLKIINKYLFLMKGPNGLDSVEL
jgi:hypothetical protein